jgi:hypothetical protein
MMKKVFSYLSLLLFALNVQSSEKYPVTLSWNQTYDDEMSYPSIDDDVYYVTKNETVKNLLDKFNNKESLRSGYNATTLSYGHRDLQPNEIVKDIIGDNRGTSIHVEIKKSRTQEPQIPAVQPSKIEPSKPIGMPSPMAKPSSGEVIIATPAGMSTVNIAIKYNANDTVADLVTKLKQKAGISDKVELQLFSKLDPQAGASSIMSSEKIYALDLKRR